MIEKPLKVGQVWEDGYFIRLTVVSESDAFNQQRGYGEWILVDNYGETYLYHDNGKMDGGGDKDHLVKLIQDVEDEVEAEEKNDDMSITKAMEVLCKYYGDIYIVYLNDALYPQKNREKLTRSIEKFFEENKQKIRELAVQEVKKALEGVTPAPVDTVFHHMLDCAMGKNTNVMLR